MKFGKFQGRTIDKLPSSYLMWIIETFENDPYKQDIYDAACEEHNFREHYGHWEK